MVQPSDIELSSDELGQDRRLPICPLLTVHPSSVPADFPSLSSFFFFQSSVLGIKILTAIVIVTVISLWGSSVCSKGRKGCQSSVPLPKVPEKVKMVKSCEIANRKLSVQRKNPQPSGVFPFSGKEEGITLRGDKAMSGKVKPGRGKNQTTLASSKGPSSDPTDYEGPFHRTNQVPRQCESSFKNEVDISRGKIGGDSNGPSKRVTRSKLCGDQEVMI